jgi:anti-anti-sigma regulatory factor
VAKERGARVEVVPGLGPGASIAVVVVRGALGHASRRVLAEALEPIKSSILVDLGQCMFIDADAIAVILAKHAELQADGRWLELVVPPEHQAVRRTIQRLGLTGLLGVRPVRGVGGG